ncbi:MAG: hypothetical protein K0R28_4574, partial [Paenibacillus sp.]|nr:hypothetical protein [Paenibacillus sp.]
PETASFRVLSSGDTVTSSVYDYWGDPVAVLRNPIVSGTATIAVPPLAPGYYILKAAAERGGSPIAQAETTFAVLTPNDISQVEDSPFGMSTHFGQTSKASWTPELIPLLALAGSKNIRDELYWNVVEKEKGVYTFPESYERFMSGLRESRIDPFIIYSYTNKFHDHDSTPYTDEGRQGFAEYGRAIQRHYEGQVKWAEVYNEFNIAFGDRGDGPADSRPDYYVKLLKRTYETVKSEFPDVTLVGPASAGIPWTWLEEVFKLGGLSYMDAVSIHPYRYPAAPETLAADLAKLQELIKKYNNGQTKPIWITELGWPTQLDARGVPENVQAENIVRSHAVSLSEGVQKIFWYDFMNDGLNELYNEDNFGIVRHPEDPKGKFAPKPAYVAYAAMTRELTGADFKHKDEVGASIYSYAFEGGQGTTRVAWSTEPKQVKVKTDVPITVMDIMGGEETLTPFAGYVYLTLTGAPIYIRGDVESITEGSKFALSGVQATTADPIPLVLAVDNTESPVGRIKATLEIEGQSHGIDVMPGTRQELRITLPRSESPGTKTVTGYIVSEGKQTAKLMVRIPVVDPVRVQTKHVLSGGADTIRVRIGNHLNRDYALERIEWRIGDEQGVTDAAQVIPAGGEGSADIRIPGLPAGQSYPVTLTLHALDNPAVVHRSKVRLVAPDAMKPFTWRSIEVDGVPDDLTDVPSVALPGDGKVQMKGYGGEEDLSGQVAVTWDEAHLYLSAKIKDDAFSQKAAEQDMWQGDSIQFTVSSGMPGETSEWHEFGIALTAKGPQLYRWLAPKGQQTGLVSGGKLDIKRDDATRHTVYELAIPWPTLTPAAAEDGLLSFSFLVNDDDGQGRKGWIEWGAGIGGTKDSALFQPARLVPQP